MSITYTEDDQLSDFLEFIKKGNYDIVQMYILDDLNPSYKNNLAVKTAIKNNHVNIVKILLKDSRVAKSVDYDELINLAENEELKNVILDKKNKFLSLPKRKKSISEYKSIRKIIESKEFVPMNLDDIKSSIDSIIIDKKIMSSSNKRLLNYHYNSIITKIPKNNSLIQSTSYRSFLCESELFNWNLKNQKLLNEHKKNIAYVPIFQVFTLYLGRTLGNDITLFTMDTINEIQKNVYYEWLDNNFSFSYDYEAKNSIFNFPKLQEIYIPTLSKALNDAKLPSEMCYYPIMIKQHKAYVGNTEKKFYSLHYSESIVKYKKTRYSLMSCLFVYSEYGYHFTFLFIDHEKKEVEYYDPNIILNEKEGILFTYKALGEIFEDYKINEFWNLRSIQKTEEYERDTVGFCVIWGHMMMHLKLLNINMSVSDIEILFIKECENKRISLYEVVLNYTYFMRRMIQHEDMNKFVKERSLLIIDYKV